ncbi:OsmC family protein [Bacillus andreraoultii]|uniref:OsmC family protein n=1 Tax=Bacillus andreraoultii TaxID=1499685 RepID=UPI00053A34DD|nr:OsmC family protein [Bacillus andreraoultii]
MKAKLQWNNDISFSGITSTGYEIKIDGSEEMGGKNAGSRPMEILLYSLAGCTGIYFISILQKMRLKPTNFFIELNGHRAEIEPKPFTKIDIHYILEGNVPKGKLERAITLTHEKYCSVAHTLHSTFAISYTLNGENKVAYL